MRSLIALAVALLLGFLLLGFVIRTIDSSKEAPATETRTESEPQGAPSFSWEYESLEGEDGIPETRIMLAVTYPNGFVERKEVDTVEGSCNEYLEPDEDVYEGSTMIICYYAGLGRYFKVVNSGDEYLVQRRIFEEASPDYDPPITDFETIATF